MMMQISCNAMREQMLDAELDELRGVGGSDVAQHVRGCADCRQHAAILLDAHAGLADALNTIQPRGYDEKVVVFRDYRRHVKWLPLPLAAAAVLALLMIPRMRAEQELPRIDMLAQLMFQEEPIVAPAPGQQAMVLEKNDMTIVWLYSQETP